MLKCCKALVEQKIPWEKKTTNGQGQYLKKNLHFVDFRSWDAMQLIQTTQLMIG